MNWWEQVNWWTVGYCGVAGWALGVYRDQGYGFGRQLFCALLWPFMFLDAALKWAIHWGDK